jgi:hypothetical protein
MKIFLLITLFFSFYLEAAECPMPWLCSIDEMEVPYTFLKQKKIVNVKIRSGILPHQGNFKGNILYFEGLGDSMLNHAPLFSKLTSHGYRIIAFDYMGQGGSSGSMDDTRIKVIPEMGKAILHKWAVQSGPLIILGWSTGGLAGYLATQRMKVDGVILIAPSLSPRFILGEGIQKLPINQITIRTLTSDNYNKFKDPHIDMIRPSSPLKVLNFSLDLVQSSQEAKKLSMHSRIKGLVLLGGKKDNYINSIKTQNIIKKMAPYFIIRNFPDALHEIDNERLEIRELAHEEILSFLSLHFN